MDNYVGKTLVCKTGLNTHRINCNPQPIPFAINVGERFKVLSQGPNLCNESTLYITVLHLSRLTDERAINISIQYDLQHFEVCDE